MKLMSAHLVKATVKGNGPRVAGSDMRSILTQDIVFSTW